MQKEQPLVSIGIPVYNGENYLSIAIESVLSQTYTNIEIIISDNASTDKTQDICEKFSAQDSRIKYYRNNANLGAGKNFNRTFELSSGKYFIWLAHDDYLHKDFLEACVSVLEQNPKIVLCSTGAEIIDDEGEKVDEINILLRTDSEKPYLRFRDILIEWHNCFDIFGLIRVNTLQKTSLLGNYANGDGVLLAQLSLIGKFHRISDNFFFSRKHHQQSNKRFYDSNKKWMDQYSYTEWFDPSKKGKLILPQWHLFVEHSNMLRIPGLTLKDRILSALVICRWVIRYRWYFISDLAYVFRKIFHIDNVSVY